MEWSAFEVGIGFIGIAATYSTLMFGIYHIRQRIEQAANSSLKNTGKLDKISHSVEEIAKANTKLTHEVDITHELLRTNNELIKDNTRAFESLQTTIQAFHTVLTLVKRND